MINRIDPNKPIVSKDKLKQWLQAAKQTKSVVRLYKIDNILKNTAGFQQDGLLEFMKNYNRTEENIKQTIEVFGDRLKKNSLAETTLIDFWGCKVRKKQPHTNG